MIITILFNHSIQALELLIEKVITSAGMSLSPGDCMRRILEAVSSGLLIYGPGILDPCEKEPTDALEPLTKQQREDITVSGQHFLRCIAFRKIFNVLGMEMLPASRGGILPQRMLRKRRRSGAEDSSADNGDNGAAGSLKVVKTEDNAVEASEGAAPVLTVK